MGLFSIPSNEELLQFKFTLLYSLFLFFKYSIEQVADRADKRTIFLPGKDVPNVFKS